MDALTRSGNLVFSVNIPYRDDLRGSGGRVQVQPSKHLVFYNREGRRFLYTDPDGHALHECEWQTLPDGGMRLSRARVWLDWDQWVGLTPGGIVNETVLDLSKKPGWRAIAPDALRTMAAQAMRVPLDDVRFFYGDDDLTITEDGRAVIRHRKDTFSILQNGIFEHAAFMACMGAMHWDSIDFLPVVELFQSLLPGTGSAVLELIRGLYDDQQTSGSPRPLRYRGIPAYPSQGAFRLFSLFFAPHAARGDDPYSIFMDPARSSQITWLPVRDPPLRFRDLNHRAGITVTAGAVQKVTLADDSAGVPYVVPLPSGFAPCDRRLAVEPGRIVLLDGTESRTLPISPKWGVTKITSVGPPSPSSWRSLFSQQPPVVAPREAFSAVSLYPHDGTEISEAASQPFVTDYLEDLGEEDPLVSRWVARRQRLLIIGFDAGLTSLMQLDRPRDYTVVFRWPPFAQKQAQTVWNYLAQTRRLEWADRIRFLEIADSALRLAGPYDGAFLWLPFHDWEDPAKLIGGLAGLYSLLEPSSLAFVAGPSNLPELAQTQGWTIEAIRAVTELPTFQMHRNILPQARLKAGLTLCQMKR